MSDLKYYCPNYKKPNVRKIPLETLVRTIKSKIKKSRATLAVSQRIVSFSNGVELSINARLRNKMKIETSQAIHY